MKKTLKYVNSNMKFWHRLTLNWNTHNILYEKIIHIACYIFIECCANTNTKCGNTTKTRWRQQHRLRPCTCSHGANRRATKEKWSFDKAVLWGKTLVTKNFTEKFVGQGQFQTPEIPGREWLSENIFLGSEINIKTKQSKIILITKCFCFC
jgi:hypothetical protein